MDWESLGRMITRTGKEVGGKVKETANLVSLQQKQMSAKSKLSDAYTEIGKVCFEKLQDDAPELLKDLFEKVKDINEEINSLEQEITNLKGKDRCPSCGATVSAGSKFCGRCGAEIVAEEEVVEEAEAVVEAEAADEAKTAVEEEAVVEAEAAVEAETAEEAESVE